MKNTTKFAGLTIHIENPVGSTRSGVDNNGKPWSVVMTHAYGEILGSMGVDGDPVDCFLGSDKAAKFAYVVHTTRKDGTGFDEDKVMLGFPDVVSAKQAWAKNFDEPEHFFGSISTIPIEIFKQKVMQTKSNPAMLHASKMNSVIELYEAASAGPGIGTPVSVDGFHGRGVIVRIDGRKMTVKFRNGMYITRDVGSVHALSDNYYQSRYMSGR
jgi:hypothetical protein